MLALLLNAVILKGHKLLLLCKPVLFFSCKAMEVERAMSSELQALKEELQQKGGHNRQQDEELISAMKEQVNADAHT